MSDWLRTQEMDYSLEVREHAPPESNASSEGSSPPESNASPSNATTPLLDAENWDPETGSPIASRARISLLYRRIKNISFVIGRLLLASIIAAVYSVVTRDVETGVEIGAFVVAVVGVLQLLKTMRPKKVALEKKEAQD